MNLRLVLKAVAPSAPPCFSARDIWLEYLASAAELQSTSEPAGPLVFERGRPVRFDEGFRFCKDCLPQHRQAMRQQWRCDPQFLQRQQPHLSLRQALTLSALLVEDVKT